MPARRPLPPKCPDKPGRPGIEGGEMTVAAETPWLAEEAESKRAEDLLRRALDRFHPRVVFASIFGADDVVVIHMLARIRWDVRIFMLDAGRLPRETY